MKLTNPAAVHLVLGQPASGKDSRLPLIASVTGAAVLNFGALFNRYARALAAPVDLRARGKFYSEFEDRDGVLLDDVELLKRLPMAPWRVRVTPVEALAAFKISYYGSFKSGLIPDEIVNRIVGNELTRLVVNSRPSAVVLNSFPKTVLQYQHLCSLIDAPSCCSLIRGIAFVMEFTDWPTLDHRMATRLVCDECAAVYSSTELAAGARRCGSACGGVLRPRGDSAISDKRRVAYLAETAPMIQRISDDWLSATLTNVGYLDRQVGRREVEAAYTEWALASNRARAN